MRYPRFCRSFPCVVAWLLLVVGCGAMDCLTVAGEVYPVGDFGAVGDGQTLDTPAIQKAIDTCAAQGGGTVLVGPGTYLSGTIYLKSHVHVKLERGASLLGTRDLSQYVRLPEGHFIHITAGKHIFLYGDSVQDVVLEGEGLIDGNWATFLDPVTHQKKRGPAAIFFEHSQNITVGTITVTRSPGWAITFFDCQDVNLLGTKVITCNCDGINPVCCQNVLYDGVYIDGTGDDPITIKNEGSLEKGHVTRNITIRNTTVKNTSHPGVKIGTGTAGTFENILVENCCFDITGDLFTIQLMRPGLPEDPERYIDGVRVQNITVRNAHRMLDITAMGVSTPVIRNLHFENIRFSGNAAGSRIWGLAKSPVDNVVLRNVTVDAHMAGPSFLDTRHVHHLTLDNITVSGQPLGAFLTAEQGSHLTAVNLTAPQLTGESALRLSNFQDATFSDLHLKGSGTLLSVGGATSKGIQLQSLPEGNTQIPLSADAEVPSDALQPRASTTAATQLTLPNTVKAGQPFSSTVAVHNPGPAGVYRAELRQADHVLGSRWIWLEAGTDATVTVPCEPLYRPGPYELGCDAKKGSLTVQPTPADLRYGELCEVELPLAADAATLSVPLRNHGGTTGTTTVELKVDRRVVDAREVSLAPGEQTEVSFRYPLADARPHVWQVGDFPEWPYASFRNVPGKFFLGRDRIRIEAAGRYLQPLDYAALYFPAVEGDFDATVCCDFQSEDTGDNAAIGMLLSNQIPDSRAGGLSTHLRVPRYGGYKIWLADRDGDGTQETRFDVGHAAFPLWLKYEKRGQMIEAFTSADGQHWDSNGKLEVPSAAKVQDVGIYANANSGDGAIAVTKFSHLSIRRLSDGKN